MRLGHAVALPCLLLLGSVGPLASAAGARTNKLDKPIYFIHGFSLGASVDCATMWRTMLQDFGTWSTAGKKSKKIAYTPRTVAYCASRTS